MRDLCDWNEVKIIEAEVCPDHVHMFVSIPPNINDKIKVTKKGKIKITKIGYFFDTKIIV